MTKICLRRICDGEYIFHGHCVTLEPAMKRQECPMMEKEKAKAGYLYLVIIEGSDHFFEGGYGDKMVEDACGKIVSRNA